MRTEEERDEWEAAVWAEERAIIEYWIDDLLNGNNAKEIRIVKPESCDSNTTIISHDGDAYLVMVDLTGETMQEAVKSMWLPDTVTKAISELYLASKKP